MKLRQWIFKIIIVLLMLTFIITLIPGEVKVMADTKNEQRGSKEMTGWESFSLDQVLLTEDYMVNSLVLEVDYLLEFQVDKLLAGFRETAGLNQRGQVRYGGWENSLIGGHTLGHYLTACAQAFASAGVSEEKREALYQQVTAIVDGLLECQQNTKGKKGFIFGAKIIDPKNVELQFDNVEKRRTDIITQAWVPWYTMHKIISGLVDVYNYTGYKPAKVVASGLGDWTYNRASGWSDAIHKTVIGIEYGGMNDCLYNLYRITGKEEHATAAHYFDEDSLYTKVYTGTANALNNLHANTTIPKFLGALNRYNTLHGRVVAGEVVDASDYLSYAEVFWAMVVNKHTYITGGNSEWERFGADNILDAERTNCNNETCNIYNMLKLTRELFMITGDKKYADYYENAFINSILSSQNPKTGMTTYFQPMASGYFKVYGSKFSHFWCCTGSGMENFTKLNDSIYFYQDNKLVVNMYLSSELTWKDKNVIITQESNIPNSDTATFTVKTLNGKNADLILRLRIPDWAAGDMAIRVNGQGFAADIENNYAIVDRTFQNGDTVSITIPMKITAYGLPDNDSVYAFKYGPVVLSAELGTDSLKTGTTGMNVTIPAEQLIESETVVLNQNIGTVKDYIANINRYMVKTEGKTEFTLTETNMELLFTPHYLQHTKRYGIYWYFDSYEDSLKKAEAGILYDTEVLDAVQPGYGQYENDELHNMKEAGSFAAVGDIYRYAGKGGWFTYRMIIDPLKENYLLCTLRKEDNGKTLTIAVGDMEIYTAKLNYDGASDSYQVKVRIPMEATDKNREIITAGGKDNWVIPITFRGNDGEDSAKVCDMIYTVNLKPRYKVDETVAYFVDCGDHDVTTISDGDSFGIYNSLTEQVYGEDRVTGYRWGIVDDIRDQYNGSQNSGAVYTANTWAYEYEKRDGLPKTKSNRYTKNQLESGITPRFLDYCFELPNGTYQVEVGFADPWNCSDLPTLYANINKDNKITIAENISINKTPVVSGIVEVIEGELTLNMRSTNSAINVTYIKITILDNGQTKRAEVVSAEYESAKALAEKSALESDAKDIDVTTERTGSNLDQADAIKANSNSVEKGSVLLLLGIVGVVLVITSSALVYLLKKRK